MNAVPRRIVVAIAISAFVAIVAIAVWIGGSDGSGPVTSSAPAASEGTAGDGLTSTTPSVAPTAAPSVPAPIALRPDWYRKGSSRYEERRPTTVPDSTAVTPTSAPVGGGATTTEGVG